MENIENKVLKGMYVAGLASALLISGCASIAEKKSESGKRGIWHRAYLTCIAQNDSNNSNHYGLDRILEE